MNKVIIKLSGGLVSSVCTSSPMEVLVLDTDVNTDYQEEPRKFLNSDRTKTFEAHVDSTADYVDDEYCDYIILENEKQNRDE